MRAPRDVHRTSTQVLSAVMILLGVAIFVRGLSVGGNVGIIFGILFVAAGAGRFWVARQ